MTTNAGPVETSPVVVAGKEAFDIARASYPGMGKGVWPLGDYLTADPSFAIWSETLREAGMPIGALPESIYRALYDDLFDMARRRNAVAGLQRLWEHLYPGETWAPDDTVYTFATDSSDSTYTAATAINMRWRAATEIDRSRNDILGLVAWMIPHYGAWKLGARPAPNPDRRGDVDPYYSYLSIVT